MSNDESMMKLAERLDIGTTQGNGVYISPDATVVGEIILGDNVSIWPCAVLRGDVNNIIIGENSNVQDGSVLHVSNPYNVQIGKNVTIGHAVNLHGCTIKDNVLVGIGAIILDGAVIEENCIIAAGSLVPPRKIIPANSMVMGSPAKIVREVTEKDREWIKQHADHYIQYKNVYLEKGM